MKNILNNEEMPNLLRKGLGAKKISLRLRKRKLAWA